MANKTQTQEKEIPKAIQAWGKEYPKKVIPLIESAKNSISIIAYAWKWYSDDIGCSIMRFNNALIRKAERGVKVRAITESRGIAGKLRTNGIKVKVKPIEKTIHAKLIIIDEEITILGSHNLTKNAFEQNLEISMIYFDKKTNAEYRKLFDGLWLY